MSTFKSRLVYKLGVLLLVVAAPDLDKLVARGGRDQFAIWVPSKGPNFIVVSLNGLDRLFCHLCVCVDSCSLLKQFNNIKNQ